MTRQRIPFLGALLLGLSCTLAGCVSMTDRQDGADAPAGQTEQAPRSVAVATPTNVRDQRPASLQPTRVPPTTMQAWIAPWEDATGDLYPASTVYIEVQAERWQYGGNGVATVLRPMQVEPRREPSTQPSAQPAAANPAPFPSPVPADAGAGRRGA